MLLAALSMAVSGVWVLENPSSTLIHESKWFQWLLRECLQQNLSVTDRVQYILGWLKSLIVIHLAFNKKLFGEHAWMTWPSLDFL